MSGHNEGEASSNGTLHQHPTGPLLPSKQADDAEHRSSLRAVGAGAISIPVFAPSEQSRTDTTPTPSTGGAQPYTDSTPARRLHPSIYIAFWILCSSSLILFNKSVLVHFRYPIFLTSFHLAFCSLLAFLCKCWRPTWFSQWDKVKRQMTLKTWARRVAPIAGFYCFSLVFCNYAYLYLSVAIIQMLKGTTPVMVLFIGYLIGTQTLNLRTTLIVTVIVAGIALASYGEIQWSWLGFFFQAGGIGFEATRLVLIQKLLSGELRMDPLTSILYFAPVCAVFNFTAFLFIEYPHMTFPLPITLPILLLNGLNAFALNVAVVFLIGATSSLVLTLSGIFKDILLIAASMLVFGTKLTTVQVIGYAVALVGLYKYKTRDAKKEGGERSSAAPARHVPLPLEEPGDDDAK